VSFDLVFDGLYAEVMESPWSTGPLLLNASGRLFYFGIMHRNSRDLLREAREAREAIDYAVALAFGRGLVCYDPQDSILRQVSGRSAR
jgi:hypothetical protein